MCDDLLHRWGSERCQTWHETGDPNPPSDGTTCPELSSEGSSPRSNDSSDIAGMSSTMFYAVLFGLLGLILLALVVIRKRVTTDETNRQSSEFTYDQSFGGNDTGGVAMGMKSPYLAEKAASTLEKVGLEKAGSFVRASSLELGGGYVDVHDETEQGTGSAVVQRDQDMEESQL